MCVAGACRNPFSHFLSREDREGVNGICGMVMDILVVGGDPIRLEVVDMW